MLAYLSLGSNLGDRARWLRLGVEVVAATDECRTSSVYETEPVGGPVQGPYLNLVVELETSATPRSLLERCRRAEAAAGRIRGVRFGPRTLDADVLLVGDLVVAEADLEVPHPRMFERRFVLEPLGELAPHLVGPGVLDGAVGEVARVGTLDEFR
ncbi:MAG TPA: 2-amino-4-hydroxy-6-hydroxymethyldihydropteridine diphosphokinase [Acidimicrobiales bacterium]|nr:2-amino-4-hydroxy-6-hydroxymethyldihydropteridine diphosphokinase [Acidimicrobiales bacterium]